MRAHETRSESCCLVATGLTGYRDVRVRADFVAGFFFSREFIGGFISALDGPLSGRVNYIFKCAVPITCFGVLKT